MNIKYTTKEKFLIVFYLFMIFFLGLGITFSYFLLADSAEKNTTKVYAGRLDVNYIQGNIIAADKLYPRDEPNFNSTKDVYRNRFTVSTDGTLEQNVEIGFDITKSEFSSDMIRYALYNSDGTMISTGYLNEGYVVMAKNLYFKPIESREFEMFIWLESKSFAQGEEQGKKLFGKILINSKQFGY